MKKNKTAEIVMSIIGIVTFILLAAASIITSIAAMRKTDKPQYALLVIYCVIGLIGGYLCHNILHEIGHLIFVKLVGAKVFEVAFCGFVFSNEQKPKINLKSGVGGWTSFVSEKPERASKTLAVALYGGLTGSLLSLLIAYGLFEVGRFLNIYPLVAVFGMYAAVNLYLVILNFFSGRDGTDGIYLLTKNGKPNEYFYYKAVELEYQSNLYLGKSAKEIDKLYSVNLNYPTILDVEKSLQTGDTEACKTAIFDIFKKTKVCDSGLIDLYLEDLFISIIDDDKQNVDIKAEKIYSYILEPDTLPSYRVAVFYRRFTGENAWADGLEKTYLKKIEQTPLKGLQKQEKDIYERYRQR